MSNLGRNPHAPVCPTGGCPVLVPSHVLSTGLGGDFPAPLGPALSFPASLLILGPLCSTGRICFCPEPMPGQSHPSGDLSSRAFVCGSPGPSAPQPDASPSPPGSLLPLGALTPILLCGCPGGQAPHTLTHRARSCPTPQPHGWVPRRGKNIGWQFGGSGSTRI